MDIFDLKGTKKLYRGAGNRDGNSQTVSKFPLRQGVLALRISHEGREEFELRFVGSEGLTEGQATASGIGGGAIAGAAIGSVIPIVGTIVGGLFGAVAGAMASDIIGPGTWTTDELEGQFDELFYLVRVANDPEAHLQPGQHQLEVRSKSKWTCEFIQPDLGQGVGQITDEDEESTNEMYESGAYIFGPMMSGRRPAMATVRHMGADDFFALAFSVDGTHQCEVYFETGQFYAEEIQTGIRPGKEYILIVEADGEWDMKFSEGY